MIDEWQIERDTHTQVNDDTGAKLVQNFPASARTKNHQSMDGMDVAAAPTC